MILGGCRRGGAAPRGGVVGEVEGYLSAGGYSIFLQIIEKERV